MIISDESILSRLQELVQQLERGDAEHAQDGAEELLNDVRRSLEPIHDLDKGEHSQNLSEADRSGSTVRVIRFSNELRRVLWQINHGNPSDAVLIAQGCVRIWKRKGSED